MIDERLAFAAAATTGTLLEKHENIPPQGRGAPRPTSRGIDSMRLKVYRHASYLLQRNDSREPKPKGA